jgi:anti-anti-sigma factor
MRWNHIDEHLVGDIVIVDLRDPQVRVTDPEGRLVERIRRLLSNGQTKIVINLHGLRYIESDGLAQIIEAYKCTRGTEGSILKLCEVTPKLRELLRATRLDSVLESFESEQDAVRSFSA